MYDRWPAPAVQTTSRVCARCVSNLKTFQQCAVTRPVKQDRKVRFKTAPRTSGMLDYLRLRPGRRGPLLILPQRLCFWWLLCEPKPLPRLLQISRSVTPWSCSLRPRSLVWCRYLNLADTSRHTKASRRMGSGTVKENHLNGCNWVGSLTGVTDITGCEYQLPAWLNAHGNVLPCRVQGNLHASTSTCNGPNPLTAFYACPENDKSMIDCQSFKVSLRHDASAEDFVYC